jgi:hypothetical protein
MIPEHMEPKGLAPDAKPLEGKWATIASYNDAVEGSRMLRDAILFAQGIVPPDDPLPVIRTLPTKPKKKMPIRAEVHTPQCCPHCGAPKKEQGLLVAHIQRAVTSYFDLHPTAMTSSRRAHEISHPRQIAMFLASELTNKSLPAIGRLFGKRDHTTVLYAIRAVKKRIETDAETALDVATLREALEG